MRYCKIREKELQEENQKLKDKNISLEKVNCENWKTQEKENQKLKKELELFRTDCKDRTDTILKYQNQVKELKKELEESKKRVIDLKKELSELQEAYNISMLENNKLRKKLEESKKRIIDLEKCIELSLEADGIIEKVKEVKNK